MSSDIFVILIGLIIVAIIITAVIIKHITVENNKEEDKKFLNGLSDEILNTMITIISQFDPNLYPNAEAFEKDVLKRIYEVTWDYSSNKCIEAYNENIIVKAVFNTIDKEMVLKFIQTLIETEDINESIKSAYAAPIIESGNMEKEDEALAKQFSNEKEYYEEVEPSDLLPAEEIVETDETLNPQRDDEEDYTTEADSVEEITNITTSKDKNGKVLYYIIDEDGKKKRISKSIAESLGYVEE